MAVPRRSGLAKSIANAKDAAPAHDEPRAQNTPAKMMTGSPGAAASNRKPVNVETKPIAQAAPRPNRSDSRPSAPRASTEVNPLAKKYHDMCSRPMPKRWANSVTNADVAGLP